MTTTSPTTLYARIFGIVLTIVGIMGLAATTSQDAVRQVVGIDVNLTHNLLFLATGIVGIVVGFVLLQHARTYALVLGVIYTLLAVWGLVVGDGFNPLGVFESVNMAGNILHLAVGGLGFAAWYASRELDRETI